MKKRMIALMLAGIMVLSVTACGGGGASSKNQNNQDDGESKQVGVEVTEDMQSAPPEDELFWRIQQTRKTVGRTG